MDRRQLENGAAARKFAVAMILHNLGKMNNEKVEQTRATARLMAVIS